VFVVKRIKRTAQAGKEAPQKFSSPLEAALNDAAVRQEPSPQRGRDHHRMDFKGAKTESTRTRERVSLFLSKCDCGSGMWARSAMKGAFRRGGSKGQIHTNVTLRAPRGALTGWPLGAYCTGGS